MKRKSSLVPSRVYSYGARAPTGNAILVHTQLRLAARYYNDLIEIERTRREEYRAARLRIGGTLAGLSEERAKLTAEIEALRVAVKAERKTARVRVPATDGTRAAIAELSAKRKAVFQEIKGERARLKDHPDMKLAETEITSRAQIRVKEKRGASGLYWGTYLLVEGAADAARKSTMDPRFKGFQGSGRVGVQLQHGISVEELFSCTDTRVQLDPLPPHTWDTRSGRRGAQTELRLRIGSDGRAPVWARFPVLLHRPLPADARVKWVWVKVSRRGTRYIYELQLTIESAAAAKPGPEGGLLAAIDIGWRKLESGDIRVGYLVDETGFGRQLTLPAAIPSNLAKAASVRGFNDGHFNTARLVLRKWADEHPTLVPEWLAEDLKIMHAWHSRSRLSRVARRMGAEMPTFVWRAWVRWMPERLAKKLDLFAEFSEIAAWLGAGPLETISVYLDFWRKKEKHLWDMETKWRSQSKLRRKDIYANFASELGKKYSTIVVGDIALTEFAEKAQPEAPDDEFPAQRKTLSAAAPNELRLALELSLGKARVVRLKPLHTTVTHAACSHKNDSERFRAARISHQLVICDGCGEEFDQDANGAANLLALYRALPPLPEDGNISLDFIEPTAAQ